VFVTPEYNRSIPAALKNAIDYLYAEWHNKAAGFVSYGLHGGIRAVEQLRQTMGESRSPTYTPKSRSTSLPTSTSPAPASASALLINGKKTP
jgi:NAD(P)H-dependent FMN reductase